MYTRSRLLLLAPLNNYGNCDNRERNLVLSITIRQYNRRKSELKSRLKMSCACQFAIDKHYASIVIFESTSVKKQNRQNCNASSRFRWDGTSTCFMPKNLGALKSDKIFTVNNAEDQ